MSKKSRPWSYQERRRRKTVRRAKAIVRFRAAVRDLKTAMQAAFDVRRPPPDRLLTWVPSKLHQDIADAANMPVRVLWGR